MEYDKKRTSSDMKVRDEGSTAQPKKVHLDKPGTGNKKLEGPNRPST